MCKILEDMWNEAAQKGRQEGMQENQREVAIRMLKTGKFPLDQIAELSGFPISEVKKLQAADFFKP